MNIPVLPADKANHLIMGLLILAEEARAKQSADEKERAEKQAEEVKPTTEEPK